MNMVMQKLGAVADRADSLVCRAETFMMQAGPKLRQATCISSVVMTTLAVMAPVLADTDTAANQVITAILNILFLICNIVGIIFVAVGLVRLAMSHAQEDGPGQQKAIMMIATGVILIVVRIILKQVAFRSWIDTGYDRDAGTGTSN